MTEKDITLKIDGLTLSGQLYVPETGNKSPAVCICHGIPSGQTTPASKGYPQLAKRLCKEGFVTLFFNFRGTGASEGNFDIAGWVKDLESAIDYLWAEPRVDRKRISLLGFSAGAAVSVCVAAQDERISAIASCACPAEFTLDPDKREPTINYFRNLGIIRDKDFPPSIDQWFNSFQTVRPLDCVENISPRPLLLVHSEHDEIVPVAQAHRLCHRAGEPKKLVILDGSDHRLRLNEEAITTVIDWLKAALEIEEQNSKSKN